MAQSSNIEWTDATVNFWWGCTKVGPGCDHCYAETWSKRTGGNIWGIGVPRRKIKSAAALIHRLDNAYADWAADATCSIENAKAFGLPVPHVDTRRRVFVQSMSDLFDTEVPIEWFAEAWDKIEVCDRLSIQIVTKRVSVVEKRLAAISRTTWPRQAGLMITVVNQDEADRDIPRLLALKAKLGIPWVGLSIEPMLGPIDLSQWLDRIDWVICGGESGRHARPMHPDWPRLLRDQCVVAGVPFLFKQWGEHEDAGPAWGISAGSAADLEGCLFVARDGYVYHVRESATYNAQAMRGVGKKRAGRLLDGVEHNGFPSSRRAA